MSEFNNTLRIFPKVLVWRATFCTFGRAQSNRHHRLRDIVVFGVAKLDTTTNVIITLGVVSTGAFCVRCPVRDAQKCRCIRYSIRDGTWIISTAPSVSLSVIVYICLPNVQMCAITNAITYAIAREMQLGGSAISDGKTDQSAFSRIADGTTDEKAPVETSLLGMRDGSPEAVLAQSLILGCQ
jgi:hypothetical protein